MSEIETTTEPTPTKTLDQHAADLDAWLKARGLVPVVVARGNVTGSLTRIEDFMPASHAATFILKPVSR
jgi:hypothetical protein